jgi:hypothetical protein
LRNRQREIGDRADDRDDDAITAAKIGRVMKKRERRMACLLVKGFRKDRSVAG